MSELIYVSFCQAKKPNVQRKKKGVVMDGSYLLRRSRYGELPPSALKKKKLEVFEIMENLCLGTSTCTSTSVCVCVCGVRACVRARERDVV